MENEIIYLDKNIERTIKENMPNPQTCNNLAYFYSIFSDSTRLKIVIALILSEMCVNDLSTLLNTNQTTISHQLKILKTNGVVKSTRKNKFIFYKIKNQYIKSIMINGFDYLINKKRA